MTWWRDQKGYEVFFNRDELKTRCRALPPEVRSTSEGVRYIAPTDPDAGGTWMLVNEFGLTICLLNRWHESSTLPGAIRSRGRLVLEFAATQQASAVTEQIRTTDCSGYKPFTLVAIDHETLLVEAWDGKKLAPETPRAPLTSSSYCFQEVKKSRCGRYQRLASNHPDALREYQAGKGEPSAFTVRMNRPDAQTWSRSHLCVGPERITWQYLEEMPDLVGDSIEHNTELLRYL